MNEVCGYFYVVARMVHRARLPGGQLKALDDSMNGAKVSAVMLTQPSGKHVAKDQYGKLGSYMVDPTVTKMLDAIYGEAK